MRKTILALGAAAALMTAACTKNEDINVGQNVFQGDKAYIVVNINDVGATTMTRASSDAFPAGNGPAMAGNFQNGTTAENAVEDAHFYFYDKSGIFVTEAGIWNGGSAAEEEGGSVEFKSNTVVTLQGLTHTSYPNYMVTVLNRPADFTAPETLAAFAVKLADTEGEGIMRGSKTYFTMSTSSYVGPENGPYYFATPVNESNFAEEPIEYDPSDGVSPVNCTPVTVYVERLAAKVTLTVDPLLAQTGTRLGDGTTGYSIDLKTVDKAGLVETQMYVRLDGWKLNATARHSGIVKTIEGTDYWTDSYIGFAWNDAANFRSYWGKSFNYGLGIVGADYPTSSGGRTDANESALSEYLKYTSLKGTLNAVGADNSEYCAENTNTAGNPETGQFVITSRNSSAITGILVKATICDADGLGRDFIRHDGILYTPEQFLSYALGHLSSVYCLSGEEYDHIDASYIRLTNVSDGKVRVALASEYPDGTFFDASHEPMSTSDVQELIDSFNINFGEDANYYTGGTMYYNIPIAHLRDNASGDTEIYEGNYGVVRNHWYYVTVTSIESLGRGIYDPDEVIVPVPDDKTYYIGAQINVLAWRMVSNGVIL